MGLVQVADDIELDNVGRQFESNRWRPCGVTWDAVPEQSWLFAFVSGRRRRGGGARPQPFTDEEWTRKVKGDKKNRDREKSV